MGSIPRTDMWPETPSPHPCLPKKRNEAARCWRIHWRFACMSWKVGIPRSFKTPFRSPRARAWKARSFSALGGWLFTVRTAPGFVVVMVDVVVDMMILER